MLSISQNSNFDFRISYMKQSIEYMASLKMILKTTNNLEYNRFWDKLVDKTTDIIH